MNTPERTTAAAWPRYSHGELVADSAPLHWPGLFVRRSRFPRVVDRFLVPATAEPLIACTMGGIADFQERDPGESWITRRLQRGDIFVTRSKTPYELRWSSPPGQELDSIVIHLATEPFTAALEAEYPGRAHTVEVVDFFGRDEALAHLCFACAEMLEAKLPGTSSRVAALFPIFAAHLIEVYSNPGAVRSETRGGLPVRQLRRVEDYVRAQLDQEIAIETLAKLVELSPFHFSRVFKQATGMTPLQFITRERVTRAQQLIRETSRSLIEIGLEVGYTSPSHFAQVFRRIVGRTPTDFRAAL